MPAVADVFLRVRVDSSAVKEDIERGVDTVDGKPAGARFGKTFGSSGASEASKTLGKTITGHNWEGDGKASGTRTGKGFTAGISAPLKDLNKLFRASGDDASKGFTEAFQGGITSPAGIGAAVTLGLAVLPGAVAAAGAVAGVGLGAAILYSTDAKFKAGVGELGTSIKVTAVKAVHDSGLAGALTAELGQVNATVDKLGPELTGLFRAVTPEVAPIGRMFSDLVTGTLPGFVYMMQRAEKPLEGFFDTAGKVVGSNLGAFFRDLAPAIGPSLYDLTELLKVTTGVLPPIAKLAGGLADLVSAAAAVPGWIKDVTTWMGHLGQAMHLPDASSTPLDELSKGLGWLEQHIPDGNKSIAQLIAQSGKAGNAVGGMGSKALQAAPKVGTLTGDVALLNSSVTSASTVLSAYNDAWNLIIGRSLAQQSAILADKSAFDSLRSSIKTTGAQSTASQQAFVSYMQQIGTSIGTLMKNGASVRSINTAYATSIGHLKTLHGLNGTQKSDISALIRDYDTWANSAGGLNRQTQTAARTLQTQFIAQLTKIHGDSPGVNKDITNLSSAILKTGTQSSVTKGDRAQLIRDLENAGVKARTARTLVDDMTRSIGRIPRTHNTQIGVSAAGHWSITGNFSNTASMAKQLAAENARQLMGGAGGGLVPGGYRPGADVAHALLSPGEFVLVPEATRAIGPGNLAAVNRAFSGGRASKGLKFAGGGLFSGFTGSPKGAGSWADQWDVTTETAAGTATAQALAQALASLVSAGGYSAVPARSGSAAAAQAFARAHLAQFGWGADQMAPLIALWNQESGWNANAVNPSSGAYGIPQALGHGHPYNLGDYANQVMWGLGYIRDRYGSPAAAERHELANHWYAGGGPVNEPVFGIGQRSGASYVFGEAGSEQVIGNADIKTLIGLMQQQLEVSQRTPGAFAVALNSRKGSEMWAARKALGG